MTHWSLRASRWFFFAVMTLGAVWIAYTSLVYFQSDSLPPFVIEKLPVRLESLWLTALQAHVASAILVLPSCLLLMTRFVQRRKHWHRWLGRLSGVLILGVLVPSGLVLSFEAKGGSWGTMGFVASGAIVAYATCAGVLCARRGDLFAHARAMRHVMAQMSVAVSSRVLLIVLHEFEWDPDGAYVVALWVPVVGSAFLADLLSGRFFISQPFSTFSFSRSHS